MGSNDPPPPSPQARSPSPLNFYFVLIQIGYFTYIYAKYDCAYAYYAVPVKTAKCKLITLSHVTVLVHCTCSQLLHVCHQTRHQSMGSKDSQNGYFVDFSIYTGKEERLLSRGLDPRLSPPWQHNYLVVYFDNFFT